MATKKLHKPEFLQEIDEAIKAGKSFQRTNPQMLSNLANSNIVVSEQAYLLNQVINLLTKILSALSKETAK